MRDMNDATLAEILAHRGNVAEIVLVTIEAPGWPVVRLTNNNIDVVSRGNTYLRCRMSVEMPDEHSMKESQGKITIDNVDQRLVETIRNTFGGVPTLLEMVLGSDLNTVIMGPFELTGRNITIDQHAISMDLLYEDVLNEAFPADRFTPVTTPGLFSLAAITTTPSE